MKPIKNYILLVDYHRRPSRRRNTEGRYRVGAKTSDEAVKLLREKIKFGSIHVYYECNSENDKKNKKFVPYKTVVKEELVFEDFIDENGNTARRAVARQIAPRRATDPINRK